MVQAFDSLELDFAIISETWFKPGSDLRSKLDDLEGEHGIKIVHQSRDGRSRKAAGGVAVAFRMGACNLRKREMKNKKVGQEVLCVTGKIGKIPKKVAIIAVYVPPDMKAGNFRELCDTIVLEIASIKLALGDPIIFVAGDFNRRDVGPSLGLASDDLRLIDTAPTRGNSTLDLVYATCQENCVEVEVLPPLDTAAGLRSDHRCVYIKCEFPPARGYTWVVKMRRTRTRAAEEAFVADLTAWDWSGLEASPTADGMAAVLEEAIAALTERHFPLVRTRRRSNEDPWITRSIRRLWKKKIRIYKKFGKSQSWWETDHKLQEEIRNAKEFFVERLLDDGNNGRPFYAATKKLAAATPTQPWKVTDMFVGMGPNEVCGEVLDFFGKLARTESHGMPEVPRVNGGLGHFSVERTADLLRASKRTDSRVEGDPLPHLIRSYPDCFASPVAKIYNRINDTGEWPARWKTEHLTIIPKVPNPVDLSECRNISCTSAFSKVLEGQVLIKLRGELAPDPSQYGGIPKCGVEHMLLELWEEVLSGMEGGKNAAVVLGVDYEKAFNRMEHSVCIEQLEILGASPGSLSLVCAFLEDRTMRITIDGHTSEPIAIQRGSPQGSVLGCLLYCATTQRLTKLLRNGGDKPTVFMYVDDTTLVDVVATEDAERHLTTGAPIAHLSGLGIGIDFQRLNDRAESINMKINAKKTQLLVISPPNGYVHSASFEADGEMIQSVQKMKLVGFTFGCRPDVGEHVRAVEDKVRRKVWMLYKLRAAGIKGDLLYKLYCCYLRAIVEYCSVVYHPMLSRRQAWDLERLQRLAVRICFGTDEDTDAIMSANAIGTLEERRIRRCDAFLRKAFVHPRFGGKWFPQRDAVPMNLRERRMTEETRATSNRRFNSPLAYLRRRANDIGLVRSEQTGVQTRRS